MASRMSADMTDASSRHPLLSLILCSRNDQYMGNSRGRLQTSLNHLGQVLQELGREKSVEVLLTDWGSQTPLREAVSLSPAAAGLVTFIQVPPETSRTLQKDSPFAEVLALNLAARHARGEYIGRIDQDTLVGRHFLETFFDLAEGRLPVKFEPASSLFFANLREFPYRIIVRDPSLWEVEKCLQWFGMRMKVERFPHRLFYKQRVGIWLVPRRLWEECGGYDERMIYMNDMETNMIDRLLLKHSMVDLGQLVDFDFYHLEHYPPLAPRLAWEHRKVNSHELFDNPKVLNPNGPQWGLTRYNFELLPYPAEKAQAQGAFLRPGMPWLSLSGLLIAAGTQMAFDAVLLFFRRLKTRLGRVWVPRLRDLRAALDGRSFVAWPRIFLGFCIRWIRRQDLKEAEHT